MTAVKMSGNVRNIIGHRSGRLLVVAFDHVKEGRAMWRCRCDCGTSTVTASNNLFNKSGTKSCGCLGKEASVRRIKRDGVWNDGKSYAIRAGEHCYKTRCAWAKAVIRHYGNACSRCGWDKARCDAHHRVKKSEGGLHTIANGVVLCPNCHRVDHEGSQ